MDVSENSGTPKSSILIGFSIINHPFWGTPIFRNTHIVWDMEPLGKSSAFKMPKPPCCQVAETPRRTWTLARPASGAWDGKLPKRVGGWTNPFENYQSKWVHLPQMEVIHHPESGVVSWLVNLPPLRNVPPSQKSRFNLIRPYKKGKQWFPKAQKVNGLISGECSTVRGE